MPPHLFFVEPMECKSVSKLQEGGDWQYEIKFDGYRCIAIKQHSEIQLYSRRGKVFKHFVNLFEPLQIQRPKSFILDGEIVALDAEGKSSFNLLQRARSSDVEVHYYAFDLIHLNEKNLMLKPLTERQQILWDEFQENQFLHLPRPLEADLKTIMLKIEKYGFEGVVAKRRDSIYVPGETPGTWVKKKIKQTDEFIVGGFVKGKYGVEELVVGKPSERGFTYVALVRAGFVPATRKKVFDLINKLKIERCPFVNLPEKKGLHKLDKEKMREVTWVRPKVVVEVAMNEWTPDKHLMHSEFRRLRPDKTPDEVSPFPSSYPFP